MVWVRKGVWLYVGIMMLIKFIVYYSLDGADCVEGAVRYLGENL